MPRVGTFNLAQFLRAVGVRSKHAIAELPDETSAITPVVVVGQFDSLTAEVIEARGMWSSPDLRPSAGAYSGHKMQSNAPGGTVLERLELVFSAINPLGEFSLNIAPTDPWAGGTFPDGVLTMGGLALQNLNGFIQNAPQPAPRGDALGGSTLTFGSFFHQFPKSIPLERAWLPAGWWWWVTVQDGAVIFALRWREIPEGQGAP